MKLYLKHGQRFREHLIACVCVGGGVRVCMAGAREKGREINKFIRISQNLSQKVHKKPAYHHPYCSISMVDTSHSLCTEVGNYTILQMLKFSLKPLSDLLRIT